ncbi:28S ribosomal protein S22, mitochondrial [Toxocara canis]|uniref:28S ribosomal protein S22, mitochondrial n=1 Tax=Toxocara canis TaxID=6265 RepID=A0A0B2VUS8_TOXCA|nr:28S ribosomal protein S22, mitochondrial [Toxocara canis]
MLRRTVAILRRSAQRYPDGHRLSFYRAFSAWIDNVNRSNLLESTSEDLDVEKIFTNSEVQKLLGELTGLDLEGKIFASRRIERQERSHYALMTDNMFAQTVERMKEEARHFLQFVPIKEPRADTFTVLADDKEIAGFDESKFVFTDVTFDVNDQDRTVVVREPDGILRTATPEEHDRMNRVYYQQPNRPIFEPPLFTYPHLQNALDRDEHEFVLDWACYFYEPDDPAFVKLCRTVYDRTVAEKKFSLLYSTRHFGAFVFYLVLNGNIPPLLNHFGAQGSLSNAAKLIRLQKIVHRNWRMAIGSEDDDRKIVQDYIKQNLRHKAELKDLIGLLEGKRRASSPSRPVAQRRTQLSPPENVGLMDEQSLKSEEGPLGDLAKTYTVRVARSSFDGQERQESKPARTGPGVSRRKGGSGDKRQK